MIRDPANRLGGQARDLVAMHKASRAFDPATPIPLEAQCADTPEVIEKGCRASLAYGARLEHYPRRSSLFRCTPNARSRPSSAFEELLAAAQDRQ